MVWDFGDFAALFWVGLVDFVLLVGLGCIRWAIVVDVLG